MKTKNESKSKKSTNPLYAVTNKGKVVEQATDKIDLWLKKLGLDKWVAKFQETLQTIIAQLFERAQAAFGPAGALEFVKIFLDGLVEKILFPLKRANII